MATLPDIPSNDDATPTTWRFLLGRGRRHIPIEQRIALENGVARIVDLPARHRIVRRGEAVSHSTYLIEGYACRYMDDREGHRQLVAVHVPGDFIDLHGYPMHQLDHDIATLGPAKVAYVERATLDELTDRYHLLTKMLWFSTLLDAAMHREWIFRLGRLNAEGRIAHFFCEIAERLEMVGLLKDGRFMLPLTQADLAEACGLTGVHANRVLRSLRERGLMTFAGGQAILLDRAELCRISEFDPAYLYGSGADWFGGSHAS